MATKPIVNMRPNPELIKKAREAGLNLRKLLEGAIVGSLDKCPTCGSTKNKSMKRGENE